MAKIIRKIGLKVGIVLFILVSIYAVTYFVKVRMNYVQSSTVQRYEAEIKSINASDVAKIEQLKWNVVDDLANKCEIAGIPDGMKNGFTRLDTNGVYSRGMWQFQVKTVQYYYKKLYSKDITVDEAVLVAHTQAKARKLAYSIIWDEVGGVWNWKNCTKKLGLAQKIEIIRELEK